MILDIPPHIEQVIITTAKSEQLSVSELITKWATEKQAEQENLGDRIHQIFAQAEFAELELPKRNELQRDIVL